MGHPEGEGGGPIALDGDVYARAAELSRAGISFALATVVAVRKPTSATPGAHGLVHADGTIEGWVGGSCAQPIVIKEAIRSMSTGQPRLLRLSREPNPDPEAGEGVVEYVMTCHSGGTMEIYVEPHLPSPELWVAGTTPVARALVSLGTGMGFRTTLIDPMAERAVFPGAAAIRADMDIGGLDPDASPYVVVATQGQWDEEALAAALRRRASYVGLVSSPTRARAVRTWLLDEGLTADAVEALRAPAGLNLGASTAEEIAVTILAELVSVRRGRASFGPMALGIASDVAAEPSTPAGSMEGEIVLHDPVCAMTVARDSARHLAEHAGTIYAFCSVGCRTAFRKDPEAYLRPIEGASAGVG